MKHTILTAQGAIRRALCEHEGPSVNADLAIDALRTATASVKSDLLTQVFPWRAISERPPLMNQPGLQFIVIQGSRFHSNVNWVRQWRGYAAIRKPGEHDEMLQYRRDNIERICDEGDIDLHTAVVTHWMPAVFTPLPVPVRED